MGTIPTTECDSDFAMYGPLVKPDGLIAFHDIDYSSDVRRFWDEVKVGRRFQEIRDDGDRNYGIGLIYNEGGRGDVA